MKKLTVLEKKAARKWLKEIEFLAKGTCPNEYYLGWHCEACKDLFPSIDFRCPCHVLTYKYVRRVVLKAVK